MVRLYMRKQANEIGSINRCLGCGNANLAPGTCEPGDPGSTCQRTHTWPAPNIWISQLKWFEFCIVSILEKR